MRELDEPTTKEVRRVNLALALLRRHVRTITICEWTGISRARVDKMRKAYAYEFPDDPLKRPSGQAPRTLCELLRSPWLRSEAGALGGLCRAFGVIPREPVPDARRYLPSLSRGEQLCRIHDLFLSKFPLAEMSMDDLISLVLSLAVGENHDIVCCTGCGGAILIDPLGMGKRPCMHCGYEQVPVRKPRGQRRRRRAGTQDLVLAKAEAMA
jgi:hypothetical protein